MNQNLILSPHLDDALLSMGGSILLLKKKFNVSTFFNTAWTTLSKKMSVQEITKLNLKEEITVMNALKCQFDFLNYPEALLRGYKQWNDPLDLKNEKNLISEIKKSITKKIVSSNAIYIPAAIGQHVDHLLVFSIFCDLCYKLDVYIYEDLPYAYYGDTDNRLKIIQRNFKTTEILIDITDVISMKKKYLSEYKTQLSKDDIENVLNYAKTIKSDGRFYERIWKLSPL